MLVPATTVEANKLAPKIPVGVKRRDYRRQAEVLEKEAARCERRAQRLLDEAARLQGQAAGMWKRMGVAA